MKIRALHEAATKGPWHVMPCSNGGALLVRGDPHVSRPPSPSSQMIPEVDTVLIANLRNSLPALIELVEAARSIANNSWIVSTMRNDGPSTGAVYCSDEQIARLRQALAALPEDWR